MIIIPHGWQLEVHREERVAYLVNPAGNRFEFLLDKNETHEAVYMFLLALDEEK